MKPTVVLPAARIRIALGSALLILAACTPAAEQKKPAAPNRLIHERSPYLLQHAHNPVDWYPWGEEALRRAREQDRLLLISIGYAACHWCHVMERESFRDTAIARLMNAHFVSVKVDREERPDVDAVYMKACRLSSEGGCGWPLNVIALPNGQPLWTGTYFPPEDWRAVLEYFRDAWPAEREDMQAFASRLTQALKADRPAAGGAGRSWPRLAAGEAISRLLGHWDMTYGGRAGAPKFPMPEQLLFLLHYHGLNGDAGALDALLLTLNHMARGGIHDQLGGGFARYATDAQWRVPHFEKMLYDNAQLLSAYARAWQHTGDESYRTVVRGILSWLAREMAVEGGGYASSLDADSGAGEGRYYSWRLEEVRARLGRAAPLIEAYYQLAAEGNWEAGHNLLYRSDPLSRIADSLGLPGDTARAWLIHSRATLLRARQERSPPARDDKVITAWNALLISGLVDAYQALGDPEVRASARTLGRFLTGRQRRPDGGLYRIRKDGEPGRAAFLDDYAFLAQACLDLYDITFEELWLTEARRLADYALDHFADPEGPLLYYSSGEGAQLVVRTLEIEDEVQPSSNAVLAGVLFRLGTLLDEDAYRQRSRRMLRAVLARMQEAGQPGFYSRWWRLYLWQAYPLPEVAIVGPDADVLRQRLQASYVPQAVWLGGPEEGDLPLLQQKAVPGQTTFYICQNKVCKLPVTDPAKAEAQLRALFPALR